MKCSTNFSSTLHRLLCCIRSYNYECLTPNIKQFLKISMDWLTVIPILDRKNNDRFVIYAKIILRAKFHVDSKIFSNARAKQVSKRCYKTYFHLSKKGFVQCVRYVDNSRQTIFGIVLMSASKPFIFNLFCIVYSF